MTPELQILIGLGLFIVANALTVWTARNSEVPNDPNIGAGLRGLAGIVFVVIGAVRLTTAYARRSRARRSAPAA